MRNVHMNRRDFFRVVTTHRRGPCREASIHLRVENAQYDAYHAAAARLGVSIPDLIRQYGLQNLPTPDEATLCRLFEDWSDQVQTELNRVLTRSGLSFFEQFEVIAEVLKRTLRRSADDAKRRHYARFIDHLRALVDGRAAENFWQQQTREAVRLCPASERAALMQRG